MKNKLATRFLSLLLAVIMVFSMVPDMAVSAEETQNTEESATDSLDFDVDNPIGNVTISFVDNGDRSKAGEISDSDLYGEALGTIINKTEVPYEDGDTIKDVTVRLLEAMDMTYTSTDTEDNGFYLSALTDFEHNGTYYAKFGEMDAGTNSGWCVRLNDWHINASADAFEVEDGDIISWLYTCALGADVGVDYTNPSAEIANIQFNEEYGTLSPAFDKETEEYTYTLASKNTNKIGFTITPDNYASVITVKVDNEAVRYRPGDEYSVTSGSVIEISTLLEYMDAANNNEITEYKDSITIQLAEPNQAPVVAADAPATLDAIVNEAINVDLSPYFSDADGDTLTYHVKNEALRLDKTLEGSTFSGTIPAVGEYPVVITVSDGKTSVTHTVTLNVAEPPNSAPTVAEDAKTELTATDNQEIKVDLSEIFKDADDDALTYTVKIDDAEAQELENAVFSYKFETAGTYKIVLTASDGEESVSHTVTLTIKENSAPVVAENAPATMEGSAKKALSVDLSKLFTDADNDTLTYKVKLGDSEAQAVEGSVFKGEIKTAGTYDVVITASDGKKEVSHTVKLTIVENYAPTIKTESNSKLYVYSSSYVYIYMDDLFEDADGDTLTYEATLDGEPVTIDYNAWTTRYSIQFGQKPVIKEYKIKAYDGTAYSEVYTATCVGTSAALTPAEDEPLYLNTSSPMYYYYILDSKEDNTFDFDYSLDVDYDLDEIEWYSDNTAFLKFDENGTATVSKEGLTDRKQVMIGVTRGKDQWGSNLFLGTKYIYLIPAMPEFKNITAPLAEHADNVTATVESNAVSGGWYGNEFDYIIEDPSICSIAITGYYGISVTPKALGTTKVTATFKYDESIKTEFTVTVTGRSLQIMDQPGVDSVIYDPEAETQTVQLEVLGAEDGETFTWTSADEAVATVNETGLVSIKKPGQTYITATSSLSTDAVPLKASMYLQVKEEGKVYLDDLALTQYTYFEGNMASAKAAFNSAQLAYDWDLQESRYSYSSLQFTPYFDDENLNAVLHYQVSGGDYQTMELTDSKAVSISNGLTAGENVVTIDVYPANDENNVTTYTFNIFRPYNPTNTITRMTIYPDGESALNYPKYLKYAEGTIFYNLDENKDPKANTWGNYSTGWSTSQSEFKAYVFGDRTDAISLYPTFGYVNERVMIYVDGEPFEEAVTAWKSNQIPVPEKGETTTITFHVNSEKYHVAQETAGVEDPFKNPEKVYTLYVENVTPLGIDSKILSAELETGEFYLPGFTSDSYTISALVDYGVTSEKMTFTVADGIDVYKASVSAANKLTPTGQDDDGNNIYEVDLPAKNYSYLYATTNIILQVTDDEGNTGESQYAFTVAQRGAKDIYPDKITEYLCIGSQYTNAGSYGTMPERTLRSGGSTLSLGHFGGHITYKYDTPIKNDPNNPYGVDFVIYGNSFGNGAHEPGYVEVSKDGSTWYTLAGSEHYEDYNDWNFSVTYTNSNGKSAYSTSAGESGTIYNYPKASLYPYFTWTDELKSSMTVTGSRLSSTAKDAYGSAASVLPEFGYVDVNTNPTAANLGLASNPYNHPGKLNGTGDQFDISWAVDADGMPVELDEISYIRVSTASFIYAGAIGEKSTEVSAVNRITNPSDSAVGETAVPTITLNGVEVRETEDENVFAADYVLGEAFEIAVDASEDANIYINNESGASRIYTTAPEKGIIRVIVQEGEKEPYIAYIRLTGYKVDKIENMSYTGSKLKPSVNMYVNDTLLEETDYSLSYIDNVKPGKAFAVITGKGDYDFTVAKAFVIVPEQSEINYISSRKEHSFSMIWQKDSKASGYVIQYSTNNDFTEDATTSVDIDDCSTASKTFDDLAEGATYYVRIASYITIDGEKYYGSYSEVDSVVIKKSFEVSDISDQAYTGKRVRPEIEAYNKDSILAEGDDYAVSYSNNLLPGKAAVTVYGLNDYAGIIEKSFVIVPEEAEMKSVVSSAAKSLTVKWDKDSNAAGYVIEYSTTQNFTSSTTKSVTISDKNTVSTTLTGLSEGKTYYVRVAAYISVDDTEYTGEYSDVMTAKVKKSFTVAAISQKTYTGKKIKPAVTVKSGSTKLKLNTHYTIKYSKNKNPGIATITVTGKGDYAGTVTVTFKIVPKKAVLKSVTSASAGTMKVKWTRDSKASGYVLQYSTSRKFTNSTTETVYISKNTTVSKKIKNLKKGKTYYVRVAAYKTVDDAKLLGSYSTVKRIKVK